MRQLTARIAALIMRRNGYRFSKDFRHGTTLRQQLDNQNTIGGGNYEDIKSNNTRQGK